MLNTRSIATVSIAGLVAAAGTVIASPIVDGVRQSSDGYGSTPIAVQGVSVIDIVNGDPVDISISSDQSNVGGVGPFGAGTFDFPAPDTDPASVTTGFELAIDLDELDWDGTSPIRLAGWLSNGGGSFISNQVIGGLPPMSDNLGDTPDVDLSAVPGNQFVTIPSSTNSAATVDGTLDASYGSPLFVNTLASTFLSNTNPSDNSANGSEINAVYGYHDGTRLYLFVTGNNRNTFDKLNLFFDTVSGAGQNQLVPNGSGVDFNILGNMTGLTFDPGFSPDYYMNYGGDDSQHYLNMQLLPAAGNGLFGFFGAPGTKAPGNITVLSNANNGIGSVPPNGGAVEATSDQSNIGGVATAVVDPDNFVSDPAQVLTGTEFKIGLPGLGYAIGSGNPIRVGGFVNGSNFDFISNQIIGGVPTTQENLGGSGSVDFNLIPGDQFVSFNIPASLNPVSINIDGTVDASAYTLVYANDEDMTGTPTQFGDSTLGDPDLAGGSEINGLWLAVGLDTANNNKPTLFGVVTGNLETNFNKLNIFFDVDASTGQNVMRDDNAAIEFNNINNNMAGLTFDAGFSPDFMLNYTGGNDPVEHFVSGIFLLTDGQGTGGSGIGGGKEFVDPITTDLTSRSGFGNNTDSSTANANGSELDNLYMRRGEDQFTGFDTIYLMIGGNLQPNFNKLEVFIDTNTGNGQNTLIFSELPPDDPNYDGNPTADNSALNRMGGPIFVTDDKGNIIETIPGLTFDDGFNAEYYYTFTAGNFDSITNSAEIFGSYARLRGVQGPSDEGISRFLGKALTGGLGFFSEGDITGEPALIDINNSNTGGVSGAEDQFGAPDSNPATVTTGIEIGIPVSDLPTWDGVSPLKIQVFINGQNHDFVSNQHLQFACTADLGEPRFVNFNDFPGEQFATVSYNSTTERFTRTNPAPPVCEPVAECPGDADGNLLVNLDDLNLVLINFGSSVAPGTSGDVDDDGLVNLDDLNLVLINFGADCN